ANFVDAPSNAEARAALSAPQNWANGALALIGPAGCGKTHLGHLWSASHDALIVPNDSDLSDIAAWRDQYIWVDGAGAASEKLLFALFNMAMRAELKALLLTGRSQASAWAAEIPDLKSRLCAMQIARISAPEDALLDPIYKKLFLDRGLKVSQNLIDYLLRHQTRSVDAAYAVVNFLDREAAVQKVNVNRTFAARVLG
ncbi:MAG: hypothetical protein V3U82_04540, partial [Robiginitomaculum sp.]